MSEPEPDCPCQATRSIKYHHFLAVLVPYEWRQFSTAIEYCERDQLITQRFNPVLNHTDSLFPYAAIHYPCDVRPSRYTFKLNFNDS